MISASGLPDAFTAAASSSLRYTLVRLPAISPLRVVVPAVWYIGRLWYPASGLRWLSGRLLACLDLPRPPCSGGVTAMTDQVRPGLARIPARNRDGALTWHFRVPSALTAPGAGNRVRAGRTGVHDYPLISEVRK
jgi:hypothetical protein